MLLLLQSQKILGMANTTVFVSFENENNVQYALSFGLKLYFNFIRIHRCLRMDCTRLERLN